MLEAALAVGFLAFLTAVQRYSAATPMKKKATLNMAARARAFALSDSVGAPPCNHSPETLAPRRAISGCESG